MQEPFSLRLTPVLVTVILVSTAMLFWIDHRRQEKGLFARLSVVQEELATSPFGL